MRDFCSMLEDVSVNIGELFQDINNRIDKKQMKPNHEIQKFLAKKLCLCPFSVPHSRFNSDMFTVPYLIRQ